MTDFEKKFKDAVRENFDASAELYEEFEKKHGLFEDLTSRLVEIMGAEQVRRVLDVGCGTGISTYCLYKNFGDGCTYYALDISEKMLEYAKKKYSNYHNFVFVHGDAENLSDLFMEKFDGIFYTASIFLIPDFRKSLREALSLLEPNGKIALSFYAGLSDSEGNDILKKHFPDFKYKYGAFSLDDLLSFLEGEKLRYFTTDYVFQSSFDFFLDFLTIPAQASGLFPRQPYSKQKVLVEEFLRDIFSREPDIFMRWTFIVISKGQ